MPISYPAPKGFNYYPAMQWLNGWAATVDDPEFTWAWQAVVGVIDAHAAVPLAPRFLGPTSAEPSDPDEALRERRNYYWLDWFSGWRADAVHGGMSGTVSEALLACPEERLEEFTIVIEQAFATACGPNSVIPPLCLSTPVEQPPKNVPAPAPMKPVFRLLNGGRA